MNAKPRRVVSIYNNRKLTPPMAAVIIIAAIAADIIGLGEALQLRLQPLRVGVGANDQGHHF